MGEIKKNQLSQKYSDEELSLIKKEAEKQHLKLATFIRVCVLKQIGRY